MSLGLPYNTIDGGMWLKKALDPADIDTQVAGLPDINTNPRTVLNYQYQADIPLPEVGTYNPNISQSYDADFYVFQNPITFAMSASRPSGFKPIQGGTVLRFYNDGHVEIPNGEVPSTIALFENPQIEGGTKTEKIKSLERYCQKYRMIYGGVQCIPACSQMFDSGTIEATQQCFSPKNTFVKNMTIGDSEENPSPVVMCQSYYPNDFPDNGSSIQSSSTLFCRYKEGTYMPYKLKNPLVYSYKSSEQTTLNIAPYLMEDTITCTKTGSAIETKTLDYDSDRKAFINKTDIPFAVNDVVGITWTFRMCSKTGIKYKLSFGMQSQSATPIPSFTAFDIVLPDVLPAYQIYHNELRSMMNFTPPPAITGVDFNFFTKSYGPVYLNSSEYTFSEAVLPYEETNLGIICFRSIGLQATIRAIFRFGLEMMITVGGIYSPFKHKAPRYDQKALNSYVRACHNMKDAFLGNAASPAGHDAYTNYLMTVVNTDAATGLTNLGSGWQGNVNI